MKWDVRTILQLMIKDQLERIKRGIRDLPLLSKLFIGILVIDMLCISISIILNIIYNCSPRSVINPETQGSWDSIVVTLLILVTLIIVALLGIDGIIQENEFQFASFLVTFSILTVVVFAAMLIRCIQILSLVMDENRPEYNWKAGFYSIIMVCIPGVVLSISSVLILAMSFPIIKSFGWKIYRACGSNITLRKYYRFVLIYVTILKIDAAVHFVIVYLYLAFIEYKAAPSYIFNLFAMIYCFILSPLDYYFGIQQERYVIHILYLALGFIYPLFLIYHMIYSAVNLFAVNLSDFDLGNILSIDTRFYFLYICVCGLGGIVQRVITSIVGIIVTINFRKGVKQIFFKTQTTTLEKHQEMTTIEQILNEAEEE